MGKKVGKNEENNRQKMDKFVSTEINAEQTECQQPNVENQERELMFEVMSRTVAAVSGFALSRDSTLRMEASTVA